MSADVDRWRAMERRYAARFPGWRRIERTTCYQHSVCMLPLIGRRRTRCPFEGVADLNWTLDHGRVWKRPDGSRCVTGEPYHGALSDARFVELVIACERYGLRVTVSDDSPYNGDHSTLLVMIEHDR